MLAACLIVSAAGAKTITGTARNDVLRGTAKADTLHGKQGNDWLYGRGGADVLVPGTGRDIVYCGTGRDTVHADLLDAVAKDCEVVKRPVPAVAGRYEGLSSQNERVSFEVIADGPAVTRFRINSVNQSCQPPDQLSISGPLEFATGAARVATARTFAYAYRGRARSAAVPRTFDIAVSGTFSGQAATGTARVDMKFFAAETAVQVLVRRGHLDGRALAVDVGPGEPPVGRRHALQVSVEPGPTRSRTRGRPESAALVTVRKTAGRRQSSA